MGALPAFGGFELSFETAPIAVIDCALVDKDWHARFSALERKYLFRLLVRRAPSTHEAGLVWQIGHSLDLSR